MIFYLFTSILIISAVLVVTLKNIFHCALFLILSLLCVAGLYFEMGAPFLGIMQLIVYVGAIMILIIFAIMMTSRISDRLLEVSNKQIIPSLLAVVSFIVFVIFAFDETQFPINLGNKFDPILDLGKELMTTYLLPFELISLLLLAALVGAIALSRKD